MSFFADGGIPRLTRISISVAPLPIYRRTIGTVDLSADRLDKREVARGTPQRLAVIARHYLDVAALTDEEVLAES